MSITLRILLGFAVLTGIGYYFLFRPALERVERQYLEAAEEPMVDAAHLLADILAVSWDGLETRDQAVATLVAGVTQAHRRRLNAVIYDFQKTQVEMHVYVTDALGVVIGDSGNPGRVGENYRSRLDVWRTLHGEYGARSTRSDPDNALSSIMYVAAPVRGADGAIDGVLVVYKPQGSMLEFIRSTKRTLQKMGIVSVCLALLAGVLLSRWVSAPLRRLTEYAATVAQGGRAALPHLPGKSLHLLGQTIGEMRSALDGKKYVANYVESLTHEMKSPVAAIRGAAELLEEPVPEPQRLKFLQNIQAETRRLEQLSDQLLALASVENRDFLSSREEVNFSDLVERGCDMHEGLRTRGDVRLERSVQSGIIVQGEPLLLEMTITNLLKNAIEFSPAGGLVQVRATRKNGRVELVIEDEGPGIPDFAGDRVFERFYSLPRPGSGKKSSGLGLCFVKEAAILHGGAIQLSSRPNGGTRAIFSLPNGLEM